MKRDNLGGEEKWGEAKKLDDHILLPPPYHITCLPLKSQSLRYSVTQFWFRNYDFTNSVLIG